MKNLVLIALFFAVGCGIAGLILLMRPMRENSPRPAAEIAVPSAPVLPAKELSPPAPPETAAPTGAAPAPATPMASKTPAVAEAPGPSSKANRSPARSAQAAKAPKEPLKDPVARDALALVGIDPAAEEYWYAAINDPELSAHERQDLIEDLNEDGLSDTKNPTLYDLPVILSRLQIIEQRAPYAMDQVNADAFQEAYRDLINLANRTVGAGEPVR